MLLSGNAGVHRSCGLAVECNYSDSTGHGTSYLSAAHRALSHREPSSPPHHYCMTQPYAIFPFLFCAPSNISHAQSPHEQVESNQPLPRVALLFSRHVQPQLQGHPHYGVLTQSSMSPRSDYLLSCISSPLCMHWCCFPPSCVPLGHRGTGVICSISWRRRPRLMQRKAASRMKLE